MRNVNVGLVIIALTTLLICVKGCGGSRESLMPEPENEVETSEVMIIPNSVFRPPQDTVLSETERLLESMAAVFGRDPTTPTPQTAEGMPGDKISILPIKSREEVYAQLINAVTFPFFAEAAEKMKKVGIHELTTMHLPGGTAACDDLGLSAEGEGVGLFDLSNVYFEEYPKTEKYFKGPLRIGHSGYWMRLEFYRLQLEYPDLEACNPENAQKFLRMFKKSVQAGNILGLDNPWN